MKASGKIGSNGVKVSDNVEKRFEPDGKKKAKDNLRTEFCAVHKNMWEHSCVRVHKIIWEHSSLHVHKIVWENNSIPVHKII